MKDLVSNILFILKFGSSIEAILNHRIIKIIAAQRN